MPHEKIKFALRMSPETQALVKEWGPKDDCQTQNEYIEKAIRFYSGYVSAQEATAYLPTALVAALRATIQNSEARTAQLLFKLSVEVSMMAKVFAIGLKIDPKDLERLREQCVQEVKSSNGAISFKDEVARQSGLK